MKKPKGPTEIMKDIAASLWALPATAEDLNKRDCARMAPHLLDRLLFRMEQKKWIYRKGEVFHTYKDFALSDKMAEYSLEPKLKPFRRKTAEEVIREWNKGKP